MSLDEVILEKLGADKNTSYDTLRIAKIIFGEQGTKKMVNPTLYRLASEGKIQRIEKEGVDRPFWKVN